MLPCFLFPSLHPSLRGSLLKFFFLIAPPCFPSLIKRCIVMIHSLCVVRWSGQHGAAELLSMSLAQKPTAKHPRFLQTTNNGVNTSALTCWLVAAFLSGYIYPYPFLSLSLVLFSQFLPIFFFSCLSRLCFL